MRGFFTTLGTIWGLAFPYFRSRDRWPGRILLVSVIAIELGLVAIEVLLNQWNARFFNAIRPASCAVDVDQRGVHRPQGKRCDIGAFERRV